MSEIKRVAVLGAGVMGAGISAHLAGCGIKVLLLDCLPSSDPTPEETEKGLGASSPQFRNKLALAAIERIRTSKPSLIYSNKYIVNITAGNFEDDMEKIAECNLVIEAVLERVDVKQKLYARIEPFIKPQMIVCTNTSGLGWQALAEGLSPSFRKRFVVTHFFNPPRYMKLVEVVAGPETDQDALESAVAFCRDRLGKGVVFAKDTPDFIANRIGAMHVLDVMHLVIEKGWPIEAVDTVLGPATGRPKSGIFRTADIVGLDTLAAAAETVLKRCPDDEMADRARIPAYLMQMIAKNWIGAKAGQGFYKKVPETGQILSIDPQSMEYRPGIKFRTPSLGQAKDISDPAKRLQTVVWADDQAGDLAWTALSRMLVYSARRVPEISDDIVNVDRAMRWGFNWALGPFETWDALGVKRVCSRISKEGREIPPLVQSLLDSGRESFYEVREGRRFYFDLYSKEMKPESGTENLIILSQLHAANKVVSKNGGAALLDLGDGIFCCEFFTKMNAIDADIVGMMHEGISRAEKEGAGLLLANEGENFSVGANLLLILMLAEQKNWEELEKIVREFQAVNQRIRFSNKPVMAVPFNMALGGGCEICLAAPFRQASAESYIGLVEAGVGLVPAGGGCKNLLLRVEEIIRGMHNPKDKIWFSPEDAGPYPKVRWAFENIAMAKVSTSAEEAKALGYLAAEDKITLDRDNLIADAKKELIELAKGYEPPQKREDILLPGKGGKMALISAIREFRRQGRITDHDTIVGEKLAHVLSGGDLPTSHKTSEDHILDLECEAFISLCGMEKTKERMKHMLMTGKPLRN
jgi:3-hydroxyacyl-CoA dehydrogenase